MKLIHQKQILVTHEHLDILNHVNNVQYVHWVEEMAMEHWEILKNKTPYFNDFWVLADHHIQYKKQVFKGEILTIRHIQKNQKEFANPEKWSFIEEKNWW